jgi:cbb3-type cytochrome oxidase subunit 1
MNGRNFYVVCIYVVWVVIGVVLAIPAAMYLSWPPRPRKEQVWVEVGKVTQLELDTPTEVVFRTNRVDGWRGDE